MCLGGEELYPMRPNTVGHQPLRGIQRGVEAVQAGQSDENSTPDDGITKRYCPKYKRHKKRKMNAPSSDTVITEGCTD